MIVLYGVSVVLAAALAVLLLYVIMGIRARVGPPKRKPQRLGDPKWN